MNKPPVTERTVARSKACLIFLSAMGIASGCLALYVNRQTMRTLAMNYFVMVVVLIAYRCYRQDLYDYQLDQLTLAAAKEQQLEDEATKEGESDEP